MFSFSSSTKDNDTPWFVNAISEYTKDGILDLDGVLMRQYNLTKNWKSYVDPRDHDDFVEAISELETVIDDLPELSEETLRICEKYLEDTESIDSFQKIKSLLSSVHSDLNTKLEIAFLNESYYRLCDDYNNLGMYMIENDIKFICDDTSNLKTYYLPPVQVFHTAILENKFNFAFSMLNSKWVTPKEIINSNPEILTNHVLSDSIIDFIFDDSSILNFTLTKFVDISKNYSVNSWLILLKNCSRTLSSANIYAKYRIKSELDSIFELQLATKNLFNESCLNVLKKINDDYNESIEICKNFCIISSVTLTAIFMFS